MATKVLVPRLGEGIEEVIIAKWLKQVGDDVAELEPLLEVNTDKVDTEIPSPATGRIASIHTQVGETARVGDVLAVIEQAETEHGSTNQSVESTSEPETPATNVIQESSRSSNSAFTRKERGFISPIVARIAAENDVDLHQVSGTGLGGRITKNDIQSFLNTAQPITARLQEPTQISPPQKVHQQVIAAGDALIKHSLMRKSIAEHMLASKRISAHVLTVMEVDMSRVVAHRAIHKETFARDGANLTFTAYFMAAVVAGLQALPLANSSWDDDGVILHSRVNLGMAVSLGEEGLIVPVIKNAEGLSLLGMARSINDLAARARTKKLQPDEVKGGTFTLTNHGISGSLFAMPIINQPQCGILGVGAMQKRVIVVPDASGSDAITIRPMVYLSYVFDHRILDGASADSFLMKVKTTLEKWTD